MNRKKEYSIWLMPEGEVYDNLSSTIQKLSEKYSSPIFEPHVTLIGELSGQRQEIIKKTKKLAEEIQPYTIHLKDLQYLNDYFKCLFLKVSKTKEVMDANFRARLIFDKNNQVYSPHLSLMYGRFSIQQKNKTIKRLTGKERIEKSNLQFKVNALHLFLTPDNPNGWEKIREFNLGGKNKWQII